MAKRYLTDRQKVRIQQNQEKIVDGQLGLLIAHYGVYVDIETEDKQIKRCQLRQSLPILVVGDQVLWQPVNNETAVVVALVPRKNILYRPDSRGKTKAVAANIDQIIIVFAVQPALSELLLDSYLIAAELNQIKPIIVLNKIDLASAEEKENIKKCLAIYEKLNYTVLFVSSEKQIGLEKLELLMQTKKSVFVGQSGVGKSSLIKHFVPNIEIAVGDISQANKLGRHTTTTSRLYHLASSGAVIDSPGVREFGLGKINEQQLIQGFIELKAYQGLCKFRDCRHDKEPGCALQEAIKEEKIAVSRFNTFKKLLQELK